MSYTIRNVGELTGVTQAGSGCSQEDQTITFSDDVDADEFLGLVVGGITSWHLTSAAPPFPSVSSGPPSSLTLLHSQIDGVATTYCEGLVDFASGYDLGCYSQVRGPTATLQTTPFQNPVALCTQLQSLLGPISMGDTATIRCEEGGPSSHTIDAYRAMLIAVKTLPALNDPAILGYTNATTDKTMGGVRGNGNADDRENAADTCPLTAFPGLNPYYVAVGPSGRVGFGYLLVAVFAAYTFEAPSYTGDGWVEELSTQDTLDNGKDVRVGVVVKEIGTNDYNEYDVTASWSGAVQNSGSLMQVAEDLPPGLHISHRLGFDN